VLFPDSPRLYLSTPHPYPVPRRPEAHGTTDLTPADAGALARIGSDIIPG